MVKIFNLALGLSFIAVACNFHNFNSDQTIGTPSSAQAFGIRNAMELNAAMYDATSPTQFAGLTEIQPSSDVVADTDVNTMPGTEGQAIQGKPPAQQQQVSPYKNPNSEASCFKPGKERKSGKEYWNKRGVQSSAYCQVNNMLPTTSNIDSFSGNAQTGVFKLASHYCSKLMANTDAGKQARLAKLPNSGKELNKLDMQQRPVNLGKDLQQTLAKDLSALISSNIEPTAEQQQILVKLIDELAKTKDSNQQLPTLAQLLVGVCTASLGSAQIFIY
ncbi:MAG: hypothetical protein OYH77_05110 [Pseudomonadota bacterium]|nr:hypothetical protein [Pseudomonadota bacterium]